MSHYATPFVVVNLGCEMLYVLEQRLKAQRVPQDKSERVLTDITTVMLHPKLLEELFLPQPVATHAIIRQLLQDLSSTSIMKLDDYSTSKLWDLMTMIVKWQLSVATTHNIFDITKRHLKCIAKILPENFPKVYITDTVKRFDNLGRKITDDEYVALKNTLMLWFSEYHTKISVLLRLGLQNRDGSFNQPNSINANILANLGENIYLYDNKRIEHGNTDTQEINCLLSAIVGKNSVAEFKLPQNIGKSKTLDLSRDTKFECISTNVKGRDSDLTFTVVTPNSTQADLLAMMQEFSVDEDK